MKRFLFMVDGEFKAFRFEHPLIVQPARRASTLEQEAYEFGRQEKAQEILEALTREFFGRKDGSQP